MFDTCPIVLVTFPLGFKARVGSLIRSLVKAYITCCLAFVSGATPLPVYIASIATSHLLHKYMFWQR